jgi:hypothetical protein
MFVILMGWVFFEVQTEFLNIIYTSFGFKGLNTRVYNRLESAVQFMNVSSLFLVL